MKGDSLFLLALSLHSSSTNVLYHEINFYRKAASFLSQLLYSSVSLLQQRLVPDLRDRRLLQEKRNVIPP